ncbi:hypothetical protein K2Y11_18215 [bacterium]|nr:hypothetical protein [bacterium]
MSTPSVGRQSRLQVESLEDRVVLSTGVVAPVPGGNVSAYVTQGILQIRGDNFNNNVNITELTTGQFKVSGLAGTLINSQSSVVLSSAYDINSQLKGGNDTLTLILQNNLNMRNITLDMGTGTRENVIMQGGKVITGNLVVTATGANSLNFDTQGKSLNVLGKTNIIGGNSTSQGDQIKLLGTFNQVYIETGAGNDFVQLGVKCNCPTNVRFQASKVTALLGNGNDELDAFKVKADDFFADLGAGNDTLALSIVQFSTIPTKARLFGGNGTDTVKEKVTISGSPTYNSFEK